MAAQGTWQGHKIEISTDLSPKYLFLASENLVKVDSKEVVRFGGFSLNYHIVGIAFLRKMRYVRFYVYPGF
jgi:hypothetical protein